MAVPDVFKGTVTSSSAIPDKVAVTVTAEPSSPIVKKFALKLTVGALSLSLRVTLNEVPDPAAEAEPPLTDPILTVAVSEPSYVLSSVTAKLAVPLVEPAETAISDIVE